MTNSTPNDRNKPDLASRYNPIAIRAVIAAILQIKGRNLPGK